MEGIAEMATRETLRDITHQCIPAGFGLTFLCFCVVFISFEKFHDLQKVTYTHGPHLFFLIVPPEERLSRSSK